MDMKYSSLENTNESGSIPHPKDEAPSRVVMTRRLNISLRSKLVNGQKQRAVDACNY